MTCLKVSYSGPAQMLEDYAHFRCGSCEATPDGEPCLNIVEGSGELCHRCRSFIELMEQHDRLVDEGIL